MAEALPDAVLYAGHVMHMRLRPRRHRFRYAVWTLLADVDRLAEIAGRSRLLRLNRFGLLSVHEKDHGPRDGSPLRPWVEARLAEAGLPRPARIRLLAMPRVLGYAFNPLSVFYCYDAEDRLESVVYAVRNTFGDMFPYALPARPGADGMVRHAQPKEFFVSPFIGMEQTYRFDLAPPGARLAIRIRQGEPGQGDTLIATQSGDALPFGDRALAGLMARLPLHTFKVIAGIHWEAARLALKGVRFLGHPGDENVVRRRPEARPARAS